MGNNTIEYTAMLMDCNRHSLTCGERQVKTIFIVTGGETENENVSIFCSKIRADENVKVIIIREND